MPLPTQAAQVAVQQAAFNGALWVWVPDVKEGYVSGSVRSESGEQVEVALSLGGEVCTFLALKQATILSQQNNNVVRFGLYTGISFLE